MNKNNPLPREILRKPKASLGYRMTFRTMRPHPITGREWVYTARPDQLRVLYDIERLFAGMETDKYDFSFSEIHTWNEKPEFDGWMVRAVNTTTGHTTWKRHSGFPPSSHYVLQVMEELLDRLRTQEEADVETVD